MTVYNVILCIGDSLVHGSRDEYGHCFATEMGRIMARGMEGSIWVAIEKGINGETSSELMRRYYDVVRAYPEAYEVCTLVGTNDAKDEVSLPEDKYRENMEYFYDVIQVHNKKLFVGLLPGRVNVSAPMYGTKFEENVALYNKQIREMVVDRPGLWGVDLTGLPESCFNDGLHFSNEGNREVARRFGNAILMVREGKVPKDQYEQGVISFAEVTV